MNRVVVSGARAVMVGARMAAIQTMKSVFLVMAVELLTSATVVTFLKKWIRMENND